MATDARGLRARLAAIAAMAVCCGLVMAVALGLVAVSGAWMFAGVGVVSVAVCLGVVGWLVGRVKRSSDITFGSHTSRSDAGNAEHAVQGAMEQGANANPLDLPVRWKE